MACVSQIADNTPIDIAGTNSWDPIKYLDLQLTAAGPNVVKVIYEIESSAGTTLKSKVSILDENGTPIIDGIETNHTIGQRESATYTFNLSEIARPATITVQLYVWGSEDVVATQDKIVVMWQ